MDVIMNVLMVIIAITSVIAVMLVLLNRGQGGGLSDMFGGGMTNSLNSSGMASKNLIRLTVTVIVIWVIAVVLYGLAMRFNGQIVVQSEPLIRAHAHPTEGEPNRASPRHFSTENAGDFLCTKRQ